MMKRKVLLMGRSGSGKTSMRSIIFDNVVARDTRRLGATMEVESSQIRFLGDLQLDLWDCGGQESMMDQYLGPRQQTIFGQVHTLIYILDVTSNTIAEDMVYFVDILGALRAGSGPPPASPTSEVSNSLASNASGGVGSSTSSLSNGDNGSGQHLSASTGAGNGSGSGARGPMVHVLIHKMDLIPAEKRASVFAARTQEVRQKCDQMRWKEAVQIFSTSIWDETLYSAWSEIVATLNPHSTSLAKYLYRFKQLCGASEVVLFEKTTMLVISQSLDLSKKRKNLSQISIVSGSEDTGDANRPEGPASHRDPSTNGGSDDDEEGEESGQDEDEADEDEREEEEKLENEDWPEDRFAKISQAIKLFRVGCKRLKSEFTSMEIRQHTYTAIFDAFTPKTYILVVSTTGEMIDTKPVKLAIEKARPVFANLKGVSLGTR